MYLAALNIEGFRRLENLNVTFRPGLNVLVGPNNTGKTAVVDALRALLSTTDEGALRIDEFDLRVDPAGAKAGELVFRYVFRGLTEDEEADFIAALKPVVPVEGKPTEYEAHLAVRYTPTQGGRMRPKRWCGDHEENVVTSDMLEDLRAVYLPPLRDPASGLRPSRSSQLARLIDRLADKSAKEELVQVLREFENELSKKAPVAKTQAAIADRHAEMLGSALKQTLKVGLTPPDFQRIAARLSLAVEDLDVEQNGLGYNNLIYMAVVLSELQLNPDAAFKALIVEEPEAHLHPQLQAVLLQYLQSKEAPAPGEKAVQVFVTSHSPNFASIANIDTIACLYQGDNSIKVFAPRDVKFDKNKKEKLQRYLDVTRAELFFARRIVLVEGTAELFIVSAIARKLGVNLRKHSVSVLSTEGLNFDCFLPLFGEAALNVRVAVLTDADPLKTYPKLEDALVLSDAAKALEGKKSAFVEPFFAQKTLEYDLALQAENQPLMLSALEELHPEIGKALRIEVNKAQPPDRPRVIFSGMFERDKGSDVQKGAYAQTLAQAIVAKEALFKAPPYIQAMLEFIAKE